MGRTRKTRSGRPRESPASAAWSAQPIWVTRLEFGQQAGLFRPDLDARLTYRLFRGMLWLPANWRRAGGFGRGQVVDTLLKLLCYGITRDQEG